MTEHTVQGRKHSADNPHTLDLDDITQNTQKHSTISTHDNVSPRSLLEIMDLDALRTKASVC